jgi:hypothetical protein
MSKKTLLGLSLLLIFSLSLVSQINSVQADQLDITVTTDKSVYNVGEQVHVNGTLTFNLLPVNGGLVALQINDRAVSYVLRTLYTGTPPTGPWDAEISDAYIGDYEGNHITEIHPGSVVYVWIFYQNNYWDDLYMTIAFTIYDASQTPVFALMPISATTPPGTGYSVRATWQVPTDIGSGGATLYASAFSAPPMNQGKPYCMEKSSTFNIEQAVGNFSTTLKIHPKNSRLGNYTVYASSFYIGFNAFEIADYIVKLFGDVNADKFVNAKDATKLGVAFGSHPGDSNWDPAADLNLDATINAKDAIVVGNNFGHAGL